MANSAPTNLMLVVGGRYHDMDYARLELLKHLAEHRLEPRVLGLLGERAQAVDERDTRADQRGRLARHHRQVHRTDALEARQLDVQIEPRAAGGAFGRRRGGLREVGDEDAVAPQP